MSQYSKGVWIGALVMTCALASHAIEVKTLGGGPTQGRPGRAGFASGNTLTQTKFNQPFSVAVQPDGDLIIADRNNKRLREIIAPGDDASSVTTAFPTKLPNPVGVQVDHNGVIYVVSQSDGSVRRFAENGEFIDGFRGFSNPTAVAVDYLTNIYVAELRGNIWLLTLDGNVTQVAGGLLEPRGLALLDNGQLAVSEAKGHTISSINLIDGTVTIIAGTNRAGFADGTGAGARFNSPHGLAKAPNGTLVVADRLNHRIRTVDTNGVVRTLYGASKEVWLSPFPGWRDGDETEALSREPVGVAVSTNGTIYVTERYWNIVREITGLPVLGGTNVPRTNNVPVPFFSPQSGYYPMGVSITITSAFPVFFTTDGTTPTTNSLQVLLTNGFGSLRFMENLRDLSSLRLRAFDGTNGSAVVSGTASDFNLIGVPRDFTAGGGSRLVIPVVSNLRKTQRIQSFQFRVEITPLNGAPPILPYMFATSITTNSYIPLKSVAAANKEAQFIARDYRIGDTLGLVISASGTNAFVDFTDFATAALLVVPIDPGAFDGQQYRIEVLYPSATSDGYQAAVPIAPLPPRTITIASIPFLVGDVAPGGGYNAGEFGDGDLQNNDANAVLYATVGLRMPIPLSDAFLAMDAYPPEPGGNGDLLINYPDWLVVLERSLRLNPNNWTRRWSGGIPISEPTGLATPITPAPLAPPAPPGPGEVWVRGAAVGAATVENLPYGEVEVPIYVNVAHGHNVAGLGFRIIVESQNGAPAARSLSFLPLLGTSGFMELAGGAANDIVCAWAAVPSSPFTSPLRGSNVLGRLRFTIPGNAIPGQSYKIRIVKPSGVADLRMPITFESIGGTAWFGRAAMQPSESTSDEWRTHFFGEDNPDASSWLDADEDGASNAQEYFEGTHPVDANSRLRLQQTNVETGNGPAVTLSWLSAPAKLYVMERGASLNGPWTILQSGLAGEGYPQEFTDTAPSASAPFYRIRVQR